MTELVARAFLPRDGSLQRASRTGAAALALGLVALGLVALGLVQALDASGVSFALGLAGGLALMAFLLLTIRHYDTAIAIGLLLMGVVRFEPALNEAGDLPIVFDYQDSHEKPSVRWRITLG